MAKTPVYEKDINVISAKDEYFGTNSLAVLSNSQILITCRYKIGRVKLIDTHQNQITAEIKLSGSPYDITTMIVDQAAVIQNYPDAIQ